MSGSSSRVRPSYHTPSLHQHVQQLGDLTLDQEESVGMMELRHQGRANNLIKLQMAERRPCIPLATSRAMAVQHFQEELVRMVESQATNTWSCSRMVKTFEANPLVRAERRVARRIVPEAEIVPGADREDQVARRALEVFPLLWWTPWLRWILRT